MIEAMRRIGILWLMGILFAEIALAQEKVTVYGYIEDKATGERLPGATLYEDSTRLGVVTNAYGFFSITLPPGQHSLLVSYVGFVSQQVNLHILKDTMLIVKLVSGYQLQEVNVRAAGARKLSPDLGTYTLSTSQVRNIATVLGEADVFKALHFLPGVNGGQEGMAGFSVRGGSPDQVQFLLDGLPVYNVNHAFGYFSAFNGDALQGVTLHSGSLPARYGGHLAGVVDMTMREGNSKQFSGNFHLSPVAGSVILEGPLKRDKASFLVSARRTWLDGVFRLGLLVAGSDYAIGYNFYDLNAKLNWEIDKSNKVFLSFYNGRDSHFGEWKDSHSKKPDRVHFYWGNLSVAGRWNHLFSSRLFSNVTMYYSRFDNNQKIEMFNAEYGRRDEARVNSHLEDMTLKVDFDFRCDTRHYLRFGGGISRLNFLPEMSYVGSLQFKSKVRDSTAGRLYAFSVYAEDECQLGERWSLNVGLRLDMQRTGQKTYVCLQPRLTVDYRSGKGFILKAAWVRAQQPMHLLVNTAVGMNTDLWVPATERIAPGRSDLFSIGISRVWDSGWEFSAEVYDRFMSKVLRYRDGVRFVKDKGDSWQEHVQVGDGHAYGVDMMLRRTEGIVSGWVAYSLSKSERRFKEICENNWFPFEYDRRHKLCIVANYHIPEREGDRFMKNLTLTFTYASGNYISLGKQLFVTTPPPEVETGNYFPNAWEYIEHPNNVRLPACHHLDVTYSLNNRKSKGSSWLFGVYNIYGRRNPSIMYHKWKDGKITTRAWSLFTFVPSVTWIYNF